MGLDELGCNRFVLEGIWVLVASQIVSYWKSLTNSCMGSRKDSVGLRWGFLKCLRMISEVHSSSSQSIGVWVVEDGLSR